MNLRNLKTNMFATRDSMDEVMKMANGSYETSLVIIAMNTTIEMIAKIQERQEMIDWLKTNDANGDYDDLTHAQALEYYNDQRED